MEYVFLALIIGAAIWGVMIYNGLVAARNRFKNAFAQIEVQLTRRHDLIPNLVEIAKKYMAHEKETLEAVISARNQAVTAQKDAQPTDAGAMSKLGGAENMLTSALGRLFALSESYPDLKANTTMQQLSEELTSTENKVAFARQGYNDAVMDYNNRRETFPNNLVSGTFNFDPAQLLEIDDDAKREVPKVEF